MRTILPILAVALSAACGGKQQPCPTGPVSQPAAPAPAPEPPPPPELPPPEPEPAPNRSAARLEIERRLATFSSGVPTCDAYIYMVVALSDCDQLGPAADAMLQSVTAMMDQWEQWSELDAASRNAAFDQAASACIQAADGLRHTADAVGCRVP